MVSLRRLLMATLVLGLTGTVAELLLLEHFEDATQWIPIVLIAVALVVLTAHAMARSRATVRAVQATMTVFVVSGLVGTWLHYKGNADFEIEITPAMAGWELFAASMMGATPVLAPGTMIQLGLIGLAWSLGHPAVQRSGTLPPTTPDSV